MNDINSLNKRYVAIAWGLFFLWLGATMAVPGNQSPVFVLGTGIILLSLNLARLISKITLSPFSTILGCLACGLGLVAMFRTVLNIPPFELPFLPTVLIIIGLYVLIPSPKKPEQQS